MEILGISLSVMVSVAGLLPPMEALVALLRVRMTVSLPSTEESSVIVTSNVWLVTLAAKVSVPLVVV